jgi:glyoxylase-like metal-dependent hydrolase (beta-lactamase superfamily II)
VIIDRVQHAGYLVNSWLVSGREDGRGLLVDTGADPREILAMVRRHSVRVVAILCTHRHYDHTAGNDYLARNLEAPILAHRLEHRHVPNATEAVDEGHSWEFRGWRAEVVHLPGHTVGTMGLHVPGHGIWVADLLFRGSVGSTVAPGHGTYDQLRSSIMDRVLTLPPETVIYPGHGETTTVGQEFEKNPFVRAWADPEQIGNRPGRFEGKRVTVEVWARDYDGGHKARIRCLDGRREIVPGSRIQKVSL